MPKTKAGYKKIMGEIPIETYEAIKAYNSISSKPLNVSRAIEQCLTEEVKKIQAETLDRVAKLGKIGLGAHYSDEEYELVVVDIETGMSAPEIYKMCVNSHYDNSDSDTGWLKVLTANRMEHDREKQKITFYVDDVRIFAVGSMTAHYERKRNHEKEE